MEENKKKKRTAGDVIRTLIMIVALGVFCYSGYQLLSIYQEYKKGSDEYHALENKYIDEKGKFDLSKCNLISYSHGEYFKLGEKIGKFGFSVKKA